MRNVLKDAHRSVSRLLHAVEQDRDPTGAMRDLRFHLRMSVASLGRAVDAAEKFERDRRRV